MHVLVTGGCGYIGSALIPQLRDADAVDRVTVFDSFASGSPRTFIGTGLGDNEALHFRRGDIREYGDVENAMHDVDTVIHLAAITGAASTHERREETLEVNLEGTKNVLTAAGKFDVSNIVFASSCNCYGRAATTDIDETTEPDPLNPYAEAKYAGEKALTEAMSEYGYNGTSLRMSTNYGYAPGVRFNLVVNHFVFRGLTDRPLTVYGDGTNWRPFIHVRDAARAYRDAALDPNRWSNSVYNVGTNDQNFQIADIAELIRDELDLSLDITYLEDKHPGPSYHVNFDRVTKTGFETEYTVREGVRELARQFTEQRDLTIS